MGFQREEPEAHPCAGKHGRQSFLVIFGRRGNCDGVQIDLMLSVQDVPLSRNLN